MSDNLQELYRLSEGDCRRQRTRIAELEAELADALPAVRAEQRKTARAEARLAAVIALCDSIQGESWLLDERDIRAAATGEEHD